MASTFANASRPILNRPVGPERFSTRGAGHGALETRPLFCRFLLQIHFQNWGFFDLPALINKQIYDLRNKSNQNSHYYGT